MGWANLAIATTLGLALAGCRSETGTARAAAKAPAPENTIGSRVAQYSPVRLTADLSGLTARERRMLPKLIAAAAAMDTTYWRQYYPARDSLLGAVSDSSVRRLVVINAGPWDRLNDDQPFVSGVGPRPPGAEFYPHDMTKEEFEKALNGTKARLDASARLHCRPPGFRGSPRGEALSRGLRRSGEARGGAAPRRFE